LAVASAGPYAIICTLLQTDIHASIPPLSFLPAGCPSCRPSNSVKAPTRPKCGKCRGAYSTQPDLLAGLRAILLRVGDRRKGRFPNPLSEILNTPLLTALVFYSRVLKYVFHLRLCDLCAGRFWGKILGGGLCRPMAPHRTATVYMC